MKFSAENDLIDFNQWLQENEVYAENQGDSRGDYLKTTDAQNYNPLRILQDQKYKRGPSIQWASLNQRLFPEMASTLERHVQRRISGNPGFFRIGRNPGKSWIPTIPKTRGFSRYLRSPGVRWNAYNENTIVPDMSNILKYHLVNHLESSYYGFLFEKAIISLF